MESSFEKLNSREPLDYNTLKADLFNGSRELKEIKEILKAKDQETLTHEAAPDNLVFLTDEEIVQFMSTQPEDIQQGYKQFLSFTEWHVGQQKIFSGDMEAGVALFKKSLEHDKEGYAFPTNMAHKAGTLAYFDGDIAGLEHAISQIEDGHTNKNVLIRLLNGLRERGAPDYVTDYNKR